MFLCVSLNGAPLNENSYDYGDGDDDAVKGISFSRPFDRLPPRRSVCPTTVQLAFGKNKTGEDGGSQLRVLRSGSAPAAFKPGENGARAA